jgi:four helix bundle protein
MSYYDDLKLKMHKYVKLVYKVTRNFPREELYGITSQLRRAVISIILNFIEGYARRRGDKCKVFKNFLDISYGSLKETKYLIYFSYSENFINKEDYKTLEDMGDEIGKMLWSIILKNKEQGA